MARQTKKYKAAMGTVKAARIYLKKSDHESVYQELEDNHFFWNAKKGKWEHKEYVPSTSIFSNDDGSSTGIGKIRLMFHPDDMPDAVKALKQCPQWRVIEVSDKEYQNRKGDGTRVYTTVILETRS